MKFTYASGAKPLDGYTIKRGIGQGGFGEVYFAVSDGGKEVALKLIRGDGAVELRGIAQCLNLKHPNLVNLYDLRTDAAGDHWVVMEYVAGEPLNTVLSRHPNGLPLELARQWFLGLARAVGYLHDHGIVHRDLKPANIFVENGLLKVGDYGLCKSISASQRTAQTQIVGTVHYMAPEISTGNYNKQIDIYACGIMLYEMLTGHVPFDGESAGEILMKHLTSPPDLSKLPSEFVPIVSQGAGEEPGPALREHGRDGPGGRDAERAAAAAGGASLAPPRAAGAGSARRRCRPAGRRTRCRRSSRSRSSRSAARSASWPGRCSWPWCCRSWRRCRGCRFSAIGRTGIGAARLAVLRDGGGELGGAGTDQVLGAAAARRLAPDPHAGPPNRCRVEIRTGLPPTADGIGRRLCLAGTRIADRPRHAVAGRLATRSGTRTPAQLGPAIRAVWDSWTKMA